MEYILSIIVSVIAAILGFILKEQIKENKEMRRKQEEELNCKETALENGVRQLLCVRLEEIYDQYANSESIPRRTYDRWMKLHAAYKGLHGNGTFNHMKEELEEKHIVNT